VLVAHLCQQPSAGSWHTPCLVNTSHLTWLASRNGALPWDTSAQPPLSLVLEHMGRHAASTRTARAGV
jgi:hypothetical protein